MPSTIEYENLKREIVSEIEGSFDLEEVKMYFASHINSRRSLSRIKYLEELFDLLETRSILHYNEVDVLLHLGKKLKTEKVFNLVHGYQKLYAEKRPCLCGELVPLIFNDHVKSSELHLEHAIRNVSENIGPKWRLLASHLDVPEYYVDEVRVKHPSDYAKQASEILQVWRRLNVEATVETLKSALEARLCKREGIGLHLLKPIVVVE